MKKTLTMILAFALVFALGVGGTLAWLTDNSEVVTNTFTASDINIELTETKPLNKTAKMVPGAEIDKDPVATVKAGSEACWLFVEITESENFDKFMEYGIAAGWTPIEEGSNIYYREVADLSAADAKDVSFPILANDKVAVKDTVTKTDMTENFTAPTLTFEAYAHQSANTDLTTAITAAKAYFVA